MDWIEGIEAGDVIESGGGVLRVVRAVTKREGRKGVTISVTLVIRRRSWTGRPYTVVNGNDLRWQGYRATGKKWPLGSEFDKRLEACFGRVPCGMDEEEVRGMA